MTRLKEAALLIPLMAAFGASIPLAYGAGWGAVIACGVFFGALTAAAFRPVFFWAPFAFGLSVLILGYGATLVGIAMIALVSLMRPATDGHQP